MATDDVFRSRYGPVALVAGAAIGLGAEYARQLADVGLDLLLLDRDGDALARTAAALRSDGRIRVDTIVADLGSAELIEQVAPATRDREIGLLVYNAAIGTVAPFLEISAAHASTMLDVNCRGPVLLVRALAPAMVARGRGGIILMSSMSANFGSAQLAVYAG